MSTNTMNWNYLLQSRGEVKVSPLRATINMAKTLDVDNDDCYRNTDVDLYTSRDMMKELAGGKDSVPTSEFSLELVCLAGKMTAQEIMSSVDNPFVELWQIAELILQQPSYCSAERTLGETNIFFIRFNEEFCYKISVYRTDRFANKNWKWSIRIEHVYLNGSGAEKTPYPGLCKLFFPKQ